MCQRLEVISVLFTKISTKWQYITSVQLENCMPSFKSMLEERTNRDFIANLNKKNLKNRIYYEIYV